MSPTAFAIPENLHSSVPCQVSPAVFINPALELDTDGNEWAALPRSERARLLEGKAAAETVAQAACASCPLVTECRTWATGQGVDVSGVAGGLTEADRPAPLTSFVDHDWTQRGPIGQVRDDLIQRWTRLGETNAVIAERLECSVRTVEKRKAGHITGDTFFFDPSKSAETRHSATLIGPSYRRASRTSTRPSAAAATAPLAVTRMTVETAAIYDLLADGEFHERSVIIAQSSGVVSQEKAFAAAPKTRTYDDDVEQFAAGAHRFMINRIDIGARRGRIQVIATKLGVMIRLTEPTLSSWRAYRRLSHLSYAA